MAVPEASKDWDRLADLAISKDWNVYHKHVPENPPVEWQFWGISMEKNDKHLNSRYTWVYHGYTMGIPFFFPDLDEGTM